jgi:hypothetical protein
MFDNNISAIKSNINFTTVQEGISSRVISFISKDKYDFGITAGDVIRYDTTRNSYVKSFADTPDSAEVFGIVESVNSNQDLLVVTNGSINLVSDKINTKFSNSIDTGRNDIYFLSGVTPGYLEDYAPEFNNFVIKPIYYNAPHNNFTGIVRNYLGYKLFNSKYNNPLAILVTYSQDMTKALFYSESAQLFFIKNVTYSSNNFYFNNIYYFTKSELEAESNKQISFNLSSGVCDVKISNDGKEILLFNKLLKKIYYIHIESLNDIKLKFLIELDIVGSPADLLLAVDDEVTCFTVASKSLERENSVNDTQLNSYELCSKIEFWKRNINNKVNPYNWRRTHNTQAKGFLFSKSLSIANNGLERDEIYVNGGIHRVSDLWCKEKNFCISYNTLIQDQIDYKSKITHISYNRYSENTKNLIKNDGYTFSEILQLRGICSFQPSYINGLTYQKWVAPQTIYGLGGLTFFYTNHNLVTDLPENKRYSCRFDLNHYKILSKENNYYIDDPSYKKDCFLYDELIRPSAGYSLGEYNNTIGKTLNNSIKQLLQLSNRMTINSVISDYDTPPTYDIPTYSKNAFLSKIKTTETFTLVALLYEYINHNTNLKAKHLIISKYPFYAVDNKNVLQYYSRSDEYKRIVPNDGTNFGYIVSFKNSTIGSQEFEKYFRSFTPIDVIPYSFSNETTVSNFNIDQLNYFELFTSNNYFFICTPSKVLVWNYSSSTYNIIEYPNLDKSYFWYNTNGEFFKLNDKVLKYDNSSQLFVEQGFVEQG